MTGKAASGVRSAIAAAVSVYLRDFFCIATSDAENIVKIDLFGIDCYPAHSLPKRFDASANLFAGVTLYGAAALKLIGFNFSLNAA